MSKQSQILRQFNLSIGQAAEVASRAAEELSEFLDGIDYDVTEDGVLINTIEDDIIAISEGNFNSKMEFENEVNERYFTAFAQEAALIAY